LLTRFKQCVIDHNKQAKRGYDIQYSFGCINFSLNEDTSIEDLLEKADREMYKNKSEKKYINN